MDVKTFENIASNEPLPRKGILVCMESTFLMSLIEMNCAQCLCVFRVHIKVNYWKRKFKIR